MKNFFLLLALTISSNAFSSIVDDIKAIKTTKSIPSDLIVLSMADEAKLNAISWGLCVQAGESPSACRSYDTGKASWGFCVLGGHSPSTCASYDNGRLSFGLCAASGQLPSTCRSYDNGTINWALCVAKGNSPSTCASYAP